MAGPRFAVVHDHHIPGYPLHTLSQCTDVEAPLDEMHCRYLSRNALSDASVQALRHTSHSSLQVGKDQHVAQALQYVYDGPSVAALGRTR